MVHREASINPVICQSADLNLEKYSHSRRVIEYESPSLITMDMSRTKFIILFLVFGFIFLFVTTSLLGSTGPRGFPKAPDSLLRTGSESPVVWKRAVSTVIFPIKIFLIGPLALPQVNILKEDPPPPFIVLYLVFYWSLLASIIYYLVGKLKHTPYVSSSQPLK